MRLLHANHNKQQSGFTLVEMLVVIPIVLLVIIGLIGGMIALIGDSLTANGRVTTAYNIQDALNRIEADTHISTEFMDQFSYFSSPQGRDNGTSPFQSSNGDLILTQQATTASPYNTTRSLVYYNNQPTSCDDTTNITGNRTLKLRTIYFLDSSTKTLWRRTIVNPWKQYATGVTGADAVCVKPWQRSSCAPTSSAAICQSKDEKMLSNVDNFTVTYYQSDNSVTTDPSQAEIVGIRITSSTQAGGKNTSQTSEIRASRRNDVAADAKPGVPVVRTLNPNIAKDNNPIRASFQWSAVNAMAYVYQVKIGAGSWSSPVTTTDNSVSITTTNTPGADVQIRVQSANDTGTSDWTTFPTSISTPNATATLATRFPYTNINIDANKWRCPSTPYSCISFTRTSAGLVVLRGMVRLAIGSTLGYADDDYTIGILPEGFRPRQATAFPSLTADGFGALITANPDGSVVYSASASGGSIDEWLSLDNIRFPAKTDGSIAGAPLSTNWTAPTFNKPSGSSVGWTNYSGEGNYGTTAFATDSMDRSFLYGLVTSPTPNNPPQYSTIATVPAGFNVASTEGDTYPNWLATNDPSNFSISNNAIVYRLGPYNYGTGSSLSAIYYRSAATVSWNSPSLLNSWKNYGNNYAPAGYTKAADNYVMLRGSISNGSTNTGTTLFTLPRAYCPSNVLVFNIAANKDVGGVVKFEPTAGRVDVFPPDTGAPTCRVVLNNTRSYDVSNQWISLAGIGFYQDAGS